MNDDLKQARRDAAEILARLRKMPTTRQIIVIAALMLAVVWLAAGIVVALS